MHEADQVVGEGTPLPERNGKDRSVDQFVNPIEDGPDLLHCECGFPNSHSLMQYLPGKCADGAEPPLDHCLQPFTSDNSAIDEDIKVEETPDESVDETSPVR